MGRAQSDTYSSLFIKSVNVNLDETFDQKSVFVHVLSYIPCSPPPPQGPSHCKQGRQTRQNSGGVGEVYNHLEFLC